MLSLEEQVARVADAAFAETSPVRWSAPHAAGDADGTRGRRRSLVMTATAVLLGLALIGGLIAVVTSDRSTPSVVEDSVPPDEDPSPSAPPSSRPTDPPLPLPPARVVPFGSAVEDGSYFQVREANVDSRQRPFGEGEIVLTYEVQLSFDPQGRSSSIEQLSSTSTDGQLAVEVTCNTDGCLTAEPVNDFVQTTLQLTIRRTTEPLTTGIHATDFQVAFDDGTVLPFSLRQLVNPEPSDTIADVVASSSGPPARVQTVLAEGRFAYHAISAFGSIWIGDTSGGYVVRLDATSGAVLARIDVDANAKRLTATDDAVYVSGQPAVRIDPATNLATTIAGGEIATGITSDGATVWTASYRGPFQRLDPDGTITTLDLPQGRWMDLAVSNGLVWALSQDRQDGRVIAFDQSTGALHYDIPIISEGGGFGVRLVGDENNVVVGTDTSGGGGRTGKLVIIDPLVGAIVDEVELHSRPEGIVLTPNHIWTSGAVLDRHSLDIVDEQGFGFTIARGPDGSIWGTSGVGGAQSGTFTAVRTAPGDFAN